MSAKVWSRLLVASAVIGLVSCRDSVLDPVVTPSVALSAPVYTGTNTALSSAQSMTFAIAFTNATSTNLVASTGSTASPPAGVSTVETGTASCTQLNLTAVTLTSATLHLSGCTGNGSVTLGIIANVISNESHDPSRATSLRTVLVDNLKPTATLAVTNAAVAFTTGANTATATFNELVKNLSATNANGEITVNGCATDPTVAISMSTNGSGHSVATATLSGGVCVNGDMVSLQLNLDKITDFAGNVGLIASNPAPETYDIDTTTPIATLATASYPASTSAIHSSASATLALTFSNANSTSLTASSGSSSSPPTGLTVNETGTADCSTVSLSSVSTSGATVTASGCTGDGTITVEVNASVATSLGGTTNAASATRTVVIQNTAPTAASLTLQNPSSGNDGSNAVTITFNGLVQSLSGSNADGAIVITGCSTTNPSAAINNSDDGMGNSIAIVTLSGGVCLSGDTVNVDVDMSKVKSLSGMAGTTNPGSETYSIL